MKKVLVAAALLGLSAISASAADLGARPLYTKAPVLPQVYDWSSIYVGGHLGAARGRSNAVDVTDPNGGFFTDLVPAGTEGFRFRDTAFGGGAQVGAQRQWQQFVFGVEAITHMRISNRPS